MAKRPAKATTKDLATPAITSLVKKDLKQIKDFATALNKNLRNPGVAAIRICECCVQVS